MRPDFFPRQLFHLGFERLPIILIEFVGAGNFRFSESHSLIQFLLKLFHDRPEKIDAPMIDQDGDEISNRPRDSLAGNDRIQHRPLLLRGDRRSFPNCPQFLAARDQFGHGLRLSQSLVGVVTPAKGGVSEGPGVSVGHGSHALSFAFPRIAAIGGKLLSKVTQQRLIGGGVHMDLLGCQ